MPIINRPTNRRLRRRVERLFKFKTDKNIFYYIFIFCLALTAFFLFEGGGETSRLSLQLKLEQELLSPVYSTPISLGDSLIAVATHGGILFWYDITGGKILAQTHSDSPVIAPLVKLDADNDGSPEVLVPSLKNSYGVYESSGAYLFKGREESPIKSFIAKPIVFDFRNKTYLLLVDQAGQVELAEASYGKKIWQTSLNLNLNENIISSPILFLMDDRQCALIAGNKGSLIALNALTGQIYWQRQLADGFISTGILLQQNSWMKTIPPTWNLLSIKGIFLQLNALSGDVLLEENIGTEATSSIASFQTKKKTSFVFLGKNGSIKLHQDGALSPLYHSASDGPFQASPILSDLNGDDKLDIIAVHASGKIVLLDLEGQLLSEPYYLRAEVTATPLLITVAKKTYLVIAAENGKLFVLIVKKGDKDIQPASLYLEFLYQAHNNYFL